MISSLTSENGAVRLDEGRRLNIFDKSLKRKIQQPLLKFSLKTDWMTWCLGVEVIGYSVTAEEALVFSP